MKVTDLTVRAALELAAAIEDKAAQRYEALARKYAADPALSEVFSQLAKDEEAHGSHFTDLLRRAPDEGGLEDKEEAMNLLRASAASKILNPEKRVLIPELEPFLEDIRICREAYIARRDAAGVPLGEA